MDTRPSSKSGNAPDVGDPLRLLPETRLLVAVVKEYRDDHPILTKESRQQLTRIGRAVAMIRNEKGFNQVTFANAMAVAQSTLSELEMGARPWTDKLILKWDAGLRKLIDAHE